MLYAVWASDAPGTGDERRRVREAHRARLRSPAPHAVQVLQAGVTLDAEAGAMNGTLLVVQAEDIAAVRAFVEGDPYVAAGVYASVVIRPWRCGLGPLSEIKGTAEHPQADDIRRPPPKGDEETSGGRAFPQEERNP